MSMENWHNADYNFKGVIDEVKLFDYALSPTAVATLYQQSTTALKDIFSSTVLKLEVLPNPVSDILKVTFPFNMPINMPLEIRDINGRLILKIDKYTEGVNVSHFVSGVYIIAIQIDNQVAVARFVKL